MLSRVAVIVRQFFYSKLGFAVGMMVLGGVGLWMFGPLIEVFGVRPLDSVNERIIGIGIWVGLILSIYLLTLYLQRRRRNRFKKALTGEGTKPAPEDAADVELKELQSRLADALQVMRKSRLGGKSGRQSLYQLPWYIIIGPPGAGKTTAIVNSGLKFPLAERMGKAAVTGVGGTRNCDWWFTDDAVLIDTAGRYTTQESDVDVDSKSWLGFLDILKTNRPRQPINGAVVAISLSDLSVQDEATRRSHALAVRTRLRELRQRLGVRFPVYVVFTKADLIAGFAEFFDRLTKEEREQVWGFTFPFKKGEEETNPISRFDEEFTALLGRLNDRSVELLQQEVDHRRRSLIHGFPQQVESLRGIAREFLEEVFQDSRFEERQLFRGLYFASGTQEGTPIDRLMRGMAQAFGIGRQAVGTGQGTGKSFFLTQLLEDVIFHEAGLVSADDKVERRHKWVMRGSIAAGIAVTALVTTLWTVSYLGNTALIAQANTDVARYRDSIADLQINPVDDIDLHRVVPGLNILRDMPGNPTVNDPDPPTELTFGLYQGDAVGTEAAQSYRAALNTLLLPRLLLRLERQMQSNFNKPDLLYQALKVYLMLGLQGPMDRDMLDQWMLVDWSLAYPGAQNEELRRDLAVHFDALLSNPMREMPLNGNLISAVQDILADRPLAERIYQSIITSSAAEEVPDWRITEAGGPQSTRVLIRPSGQPLSEGVEGIYTYRGFTDVFIEEALEVSTRMQREAWVLGERGAAELSDDAALARLSRDVLNLYYDDYVDRWDRVLADIDIVPPASLADAVRITNILSGANSPLRNILESAARETQLTRKPELDVDAPVDSETVSALGDQLTNDARMLVDDRTRRLIETLAGGNSVGGILTGQSEEEVEQPGQYVEDQFAWLHQLTFVEEGVPSTVELVIQEMRDVYDELNRMSLGNTGVIQQATSDEGGAPTRLLETANELEQGPLKRWAMQVVQSASSNTAGKARSNLNSQWTSQILPLCERTLEGRYPFQRGSSSDMALQDFARLFAPGGLIDSFFKENLIDFVDTTAKPWRWKQVNGADLGISPAVLTQFQHAADIRDAFFLSAGAPTVTFEMKPIALDTKATSVILELEGQQLEYAHQVPLDTPMQWPGQGGGRTRVAFTPQLPGTSNSLSAEGPWALFRLFDQAEIRTTNVSDRIRIVFSVGGRVAVFQLRAGSALNPFSLPALQAFRCVKSL